MDEYAKLGETFKAAFANKTLVMQVGTVKSVEGDTSTVAFGGMVITGVRLRVEKGGAAERLLITPAIGSLVLCGSLTGDFKDLIVLKAERIAKLRYDENGTSVEIDSETGKVKVTNEQVSLKDLFDDLKDIIQNLKVFTPAGPSGNPLPDTITSLNVFQNKINQLLN